MTNSEENDRGGYLMTGRRYSHPFEFRFPDLIRHLRRIEGCSESVTLN